MTRSDETAPNYSIELEVEVPGTPEQVWDAIATGPGIAAWFVPADVAAHEGGSISLDMGSGMDAAGVITGWDPPRRLTYEEIWEPADVDAKSRLATEFLVEARSGDSCVVRLVTNVFGSTSDWGDELESMREGWTVFLHNLQLYMTDFPGQECSTVMATGQASGSLDDAWSAFATALGVKARPSQGERVATSTSDAGPAFAGTVDTIVDGEFHRGLVLRSESPAPGVMLAFAYFWRGQAHTYVHGYLFGDEAAAIAERENGDWKAWMADHFPMADADALTS
jgi:uncharacterized protein YndB with AHSA1/START domain